MLISKQWAVVILLLYSTGCAFQQHAFDPYRKIRPLPGESLIIPWTDLSKNHFCNPQKRTSEVALKINQVNPTVIKPGDEVHHHFNYLSCTSTERIRISGQLIRSIYYNGHVVFRDIIKPFEVKPGEWSVDAYIKVPEAAKKGVYSLAVYFKSQNKRYTFNNIQHFYVDSGEKPNTNTAMSR